MILRGRPARFVFGADEVADGLQEKAPPGWEDVAERLKGQPGVENPFAVTWAMVNKGYQRRGKEGQPYAPDALLRRLQHECGAQFDEAVSLAQLGPLARKGARPGSTPPQEAFAKPKGAFGSTFKNPFAIKPTARTHAPRARHATQPRHRAAEAMKESRIVRPSLTWFTPLREARREAGDQAGTPQVVLITAGPGNRRDGNFYPPEVLERDHKVFEGVKCFLNHPGVLEEENRPEREVEGIGGWFNSVRIAPLDTTAAIIADLKYCRLQDETLTAEGERTRGYIESALVYQRDYPGNDKVLLGFSINAEGPSDEMPTEAVQSRWPQFREALQARPAWNVVQAIESAVSVDCVTFPARGGRVLGLREAEGLVESHRWRAELLSIVQPSWRSQFLSVLERAA